MIHIKSTREIELMRTSCLLAAQTLTFVKEYIRIGVATEELNKLCHDFIVKNGAYPSPLNYRGFPKSICTSINDVICHGIPSEKELLKDGDIINVDITTYLNKFHGDTSKTFLIGNVSEPAKKLVQTAYDCLMLGIKEVKPGARLGNIGAAIGQYAGDLGYSIVTDYCGHGIGREFHEDPQVVHFANRGEGVEMKPGMIFTIEPMINMGKKHTKLLRDDWTVKTKDGKLSAQFEHTILVTDTNDLGYEILTIDPASPELYP